MTYLEFVKAWLRYLPMNVSLPGLVRWRPLREPKLGYSIIIGCMNNMPAIAIANVAFIAKMHLPNMRRLILVFDVEESKISYKQQVLDAAQNLPIEIIGYDAKQAAVAKFFSWGWVYSWLSWTKGIAIADTRYALLHDLDAMPTNPHLFEDLYEQMQSHNSMFQGIRSYTNQYFSAESGLVRTFEMFVDIQKLRQDFSPFDAFNKVKLVNGNLVIYDTFLYIQSQTNSCHLASAITQDKLVHPSQLISQYTDFLRNRVTKGFWEKYANLPLFPIYNFLGENSTLLNSIISHIQSSQDPNLPFMGKSINFSGVPSHHWQWIWEQARTLQIAYYGDLNPEIEQYINSVKAVYDEG
ncbi:hypothetical protein [Sphaerothrix gracilis]|uniref:hypothetical protein n=1 Tax=Sphaerothrix gracilis TaxID=3151835 RepID=UPI0031FD60AD